MTRAMIDNDLLPAPDSYLITFDRAMADDEATGETMVTVDLDNFHISLSNITDAYHSDLLNLTAAAWVRDDGAYLAALTTEWGQTMGTDGAIEFFLFHWSWPPAMKRLHLSEILPELGDDDFLDPAPGQEQVCLRPSDLAYRLPRNGTSIKAYIRNLDELGPEFFPPESSCFKRLKDIEHIDLTWNGQIFDKAPAGKNKRQIRPGAAAEPSGLPRYFMEAMTGECLRANLNDGRLSSDCRNSAAPVCAEKVLAGCHGNLAELRARLSVASVFALPQCPRTPTKDDLLSGSSPNLPPAYVCLNRPGDYMLFVTGGHFSEIWQAAAWPTNDGKKLLAVNRDLTTATGDSQIAARDIFFYLIDENRCWEAEEVLVSQIFAPQELAESLADKKSAGNIYINLGHSDENFLEMLHYDYPKTLKMNRRFHWDGQSFRSAPEL
ncbi:hypothetical protein C4J81_06925 [Deltaproteobacteria bacterium Smac51]|nr:hypothetical protein C4J81_06925 [Deltaproteobacteria bacterium Smac51]